MPKISGGEITFQFFVGEFDNERTDRHYSTPSDTLIPFTAVQNLVLPCDLTFRVTVYNHVVAVLVPSSY